MTDLHYIISSAVLGVGDLLGPERLRFCLIVYHDNAERPMFVGGNADDTPHLLKILASAGDGIEFCTGVQGGSA